jgi:hypothetical protein
MDKMMIMDFLGMTKDVVDQGDGSIQTVMDQEEMARRSKAMAEQLQAMTAPRNLNMELMQAPQPQMQQMQQPMVNPYAPVNYGTMQPQMTGGIGSVPTLDQVLAALQARQ